MALRTVTFKAEEKFIEKLYRFAEEKGAAVSEVIRTALSWYIRCQKITIIPLLN